MIPRADIIQWGVNHDWQTENQIEQDLLLSRAMIEIANDPELNSELLLRGGTAFHKLFLPEPLRYSEDLDYVRTGTGAIGNTMRKLTDLGVSLGFEVRTQMGRFPKLFWRFDFQDGSKGKIKIEIDAFEHSPVLPINKMLHEVVNPFYTNQGTIPTFQPEELVATKIRALFQRKKGRDLFDIWLALTVLEVDPEGILRAFPTYRPQGLNAQLSISNLEEKLQDQTFIHDVSPMIKANYPGYDALKAAEEVKNRLLRLI